MAYDPNTTRPDLRTTPVERRSSMSWAPWVAVIAVVLVGLFVWSNMSGTATDPNPTASTTPPAVTTQEPAPATPAAPPADNMAPATPATPPAGGTTQP